MNEGKILSDVSVAIAIRFGKQPTHYSTVQQVYYVKKRGPGDLLFFPDCQVVPLIMASSRTFF